MQSYVPSIVRATASSAAKVEVPESNDFLHISFGNECQICLGSCLKSRRLPCEHEFCKTCLESLFENKQNEELRCPVCNHPIEIPADKPKSKWTKSFKVDKRTLFYTKTKADGEQQQEPPLRKSISFSNSTHTRTGDHQTELTRSLSLSLTRRSPIPEDGGENVPGFSCKTHTDRMNCTHWGSDVFTNGDIVVADWTNSKIKLFNKNGVLVSDLQTKTPPLDVAVVQDVIVTSFGSKASELYFLMVQENQLTLSRMVPINGHIYSISRCGPNCLGIYELSDNTITFVEIKIRKGVLKLYPLGVTKTRLSSNSGIACSATTRLIFCSEKHTIYCIGTGGSLKYEATFPRLQTDDEQLGAIHSLGALSCDTKGRVYVASDFCVLQLTPEGNLLNVFPTKIDPFTISVMPCNDSIVIAGRNNIIEVLRLEHGVQAS